MNDDSRILELMNLAIDGEATPEQLAELQQVLITSFDARVTYEAMQNLAAELDTERNAEPPPTLKDEILNALRQKQGVVPLFSRRSGKRVLAAAAAAAFLAIALAVMVRRDSVNPADARATIGSPASRGVIEETANGATVTVRIRGRAVEVSAAGPAGAEVSWDGTRLSLLETKPPMADTPRIAQTGKLPIGSAEVVTLHLSRSGENREPGSVAVTQGGRELVRVTIPAK
jgi:hypothetical protein